MYLDKILQRYAKDKLLLYSIFIRMMILITAVENAELLLYYYILLLNMTLTEIAESKLYLFNYYYLLNYYCKLIYY